MLIQGWLHGSDGGGRGGASWPLFHVHCGIYAYYVHVDID